jgi:CubicO group peptidase (beta-lactamase class C family)
MTHEDTTRTTESTGASGDGAVPLAGYCDPRFEAVRDAFTENFTERDEFGAAVCITVSGRTVVDLWGGHADADRTVDWQPDTLVNAFSVGKSLVALLALDLIGRGRLELDEPVARWWPAFRHHGKGEVTLRHLLSHQAGLPALRRRMPPGAMFDWERMSSSLATEQPWWQPGTAHGYHTNTYGFLVGEILRRVTDRTVGELLAERVAGPLDADVHLGLPPRQDTRVAEFLWSLQPPPECEPEGLTGDDLMRYNAYFNPSGLSGAGVVNTRAWRAAEIPSTNPHASARGIARVYTTLAAGGQPGRVPIVDGAVLREAISEQVHGLDRILQRTTRFGLGFQLTHPERSLGPNPNTFGHFGAGGTLALADPDADLALGYVTNRMGAPLLQSPRNRALIDAAYAALT